MKRASPDPLPRLIQAFFCERLQAQRQVSPCTVGGYRDTFRLLLKFVQRETHRSPDQQRLQDLGTPLILRFLDHLEKERHNTTRTRNARLAAIRSFMHFVAYEEPAAVAITTRVLAIPTKRYDRPLLEVVALSRADIRFGPPCLVQLRGKGRKQRAVPVWKSTAKALKLWLKNAPNESDAPLFSNRFGERLSRSGVEKRLRLTVQAAIPRCRSLHSRAMSPHTFRHTTAMHLLENGVDITVIALWLGHESPATTHHYIELDLSMKQRALQKLPALKTKSCRFEPSDQLLTFLEGL